MTTTETSLMSVYRGWEGYQTSLVRAVAPLTTEQAAFRAAPDLSSVGEIARHIHTGRLSWFLNMDAPTSAELAGRLPGWVRGDTGNWYVDEEALSAEPAALVRGLEDTWGMIEATLTQWSVADLEQTYRHPYDGKMYAVSRQWTIWRILSHDMHHGGQLSMLLYMQGIEIPELGYLGGHLTEPPLADEGGPK